MAIAMHRLEEKCTDCLLVLSGHWLFFPECYSAEKQSLQQARLLQQQEDEHEADGEEDDDEEEDEQEDMWRRRRGSPEGRPEPKGHGFSDEALRKRVVGNRDDEDDEEDT